MSKAAKKRAHKAATIAKALAVKEQRTAPTPRLVVDKPTDWKAETEKLELNRARVAGASRSEAQEASELVKVAKSPGVVRVRGRDGLLALYDNGQLTGKDSGRTPDDWMKAMIRLQAGLAYREAYQPNSGSMRSQLEGGVGGGHVGASDKFVWAGLRAAKAHLKVDEIERAVLERYPSGKELHALRMIAGEGRTARSLAKNGREQAAWIVAVLNALDVAAAMLRLA